MNNFDDFRDFLAPLGTTLGTTLLVALLDAPAGGLLRNGVHPTELPHGETEVETARCRRLSANVRTLDMASKVQRK